MQDLAAPAFTSFTYSARHFAYSVISETTGSPE